LHSSLHAKLTSAITVMAVGSNQTVERLPLSQNRPMA
jgi:hypothetical protein